MFFIVGLFGGQYKAWSISQNLTTDPLSAHVYTTVDFAKKIIETAALQDVMKVMKRKEMIHALRLKGNSCEFSEF